MICVLSCSIEAITRLQPNSGHYTAYVRASDAEWYHCDDAKPPRRCENGIADVMQAQAYMLFYEQR